MEKVNNHAHKRYGNNQICRDHQKPISFTEFLFENFAFESRSLNAFPKGAKIVNKHRGSSA